MNARRLRDLMTCLENKQELLVELPDGSLFEITTICIPDDDKAPAHLVVTPFVPLP